MPNNSSQVYLRLANKAFSEIRQLIASGDYQQVHELADSLHNLGDWDSTQISLQKLVEDFPTKSNHDLLNIFSEIPKTIGEHVTPEWREKNYPLQQIIINLQGTKRITFEGFRYLLEEVSRRLQAGDKSGLHHDDDFGYVFEVSTSQDSFFEKPFEYR